MQFLIKNKGKGIRWKAFDNPSHCPNISTVGMLDYACGVRVASRDAHPGHFEIHLVSKGFQMFLADESFVSLHAGEILVTRPGQVHGFAHDIINPAVIYWVRIPVKLSAGISPQDADLITKHLQKISGRICIEPTPIICHLINGMFDLLDSDSSDPASRFKLKNLSMALVSSLLNISPQGKHTGQDSGIIKRIYKIIKKINVAPDQPCKVPAMAKECGAGETHFRRLFKKTTGFSPVDYIHFTRTEKAKKLLSQGTSVTATAYELGYSSSQHFCRTFSRWTGTAPSSYLNQKPNPLKIITRSSDRLIYQGLHRIYGSS
jgi:AraC-like DNA-binding protein